MSKVPINRDTMMTIGTPDYNLALKFFPVRKVCITSNAPIVPFSYVDGISVTQHFVRASSRSDVEILFFSIHLHLDMLFQLILH